MSPPLLSPAADEHLSDFVHRAMRERGLSVAAVASQLAQGGLDPDSAIRKVKRLRSGGTDTVTRATADALGPVLRADLTPFVRSRSNGPRPSMFGQILAAVEELRGRQLEFQAQLDEMQERLGAVERGRDPGG